MTGQARIVERDAVDISEAAKESRSKYHRHCLTDTLLAVPVTTTPETFTPQRLFAKKNYKAQE